MRKVANIMELIGGTPVVKLNRLTNEEMADVSVKLEYFNPGGSVKDRIALAMIEKAEEEGLLGKDSVIIEPTSGNTGIGLAMVAAAKGYKIILVMPETMSIERRKLMKVFGAEIILTSGQLGMKGAIDKSKELAETNPGYFLPMQFDNFANPEMHEKTTAREIIDQMGDSLDAIVCGVGTGGTITGVGNILKQAYKDIKVIAVEPEDSPVLSGGKPGPHKIQGIGAGFVPKVLNVEILDKIVKVSNENAIKTALQLAKQEGILAGISTGASVYAALAAAKELGRGKTVLTFAHDTGERYLSTDMYKDFE
ncbi:MAG: cysteine synthase A [Clostridia bacterium]